MHENGAGGGAIPTTTTTKAVKSGGGVTWSSTLTFPLKLLEGTCGVWLSVAVTHGLPRYWAAFTANHSITRK